MFKILYELIHEESLEIFLLSTDYLLSCRSLIITLIAIGISNVY